MLTFLVCTGLILSAQQAEDIIQKYSDAVGGKEKLAGLKTLKMEGNIEVAQAPGQAFGFTMLRKSPNKMKLVMDIMGQQIIPQAYDGEVGWTINPFAGSAEPQKLPEDQMASMKDNAAFDDPFVFFREKGYTVTYEGTGEAEGVSCHILKLVKPGEAGEEGSTTLCYFDAETYLQMMLKQKDTQMDGQEVEIVFSDYQDIGDGVIMPFGMETRMQGQSIMKMSFTAISANPEISDSEFAFPAAAEGSTP